MTDPTPLSPAAQAVLDAYGHYSESWCGTSWGSTLIPVLTSQESRSRLLALATELEKGNEY